MMNRIPVRTKKSLGQHFLVDPNIVRNIVGAFDPAPGDRVIEIGPGMGALTALLVESGARVTAVEVDERVIASLRETFPDPEKPAIVHGDILKLDLRILAAPGERLRVVGNLPYNITSPILFHVFRYADIVQDALFMMQKEVAERIVSPPGRKQYGILSVLSALYSDVHIAFKVSPNVFHPRPEVWSAVAHFQFRSDRLARVRDVETFRAVVRGGFNQRRKTLGNALKAIGITADMLPDALRGCLTLRAEQLSMDDFLELANALPSREPAAGTGPSSSPPHGGYETLFPPS